VKVLFLIDCLDNGGAERQMALLATHLPAEWGRSVCALDRGPFEDYLHEKSVALEVYPRTHSLDPRPIASVWRSLRTLRPDIVHSWSWISTMVAGPMCRLVGVPLIDGTIRTGALQRDHLALKRLGMASSSMIVANTHAGLQAWGVGSTKGRVVHNGFDWSRLDSSAHDGDSETAAEGRVDAIMTIVMIGRMVPARDFRVVIAAARLLREAGGRYRFLLVGHGPQRNELMAEAADLVPDGAVTFPDPGIEVIRHVRSADVGVLMTDPRWAQEGCSNAIMEYMACGLPVLCGASGGNREIVDDGHTGFLIPSADARALAQRLEYLREHREQCRAMGIAGQRRIESHFSIERMVGRYLRIYAESLGR